MTTIQEKELVTNKLIINPEYEKLIPAPTDEDYKGLYESIKEEGLKIPIAVNQDNVILDGHHRYKICQELGKETRTIEYNFETPEDERDFVIDANIERRQLTTWARVQLAYKLKSIYEVDIEKQRRKKISKFRKGDPVGIPTGSKTDENYARTKACKKAKISTDTFSLGGLPRNKKYDLPNEELDQEIQKIFNKFNIEEGRIKEGETVKLFPDQLQPLRTLYRSY